MKDIGNRIPTSAYKSLSTNINILVTGTSSQVSISKIVFKYNPNFLQLIAVCYTFMEKYIYNKKDEINSHRSVGNKLPT